MEKEKNWKTIPFQNDDGKWIPRAVITIRENGENRDIEINAPEFEYDDKKEAEQHALYLVKDYGA